MINRGGQKFKAKPTRKDDSDVDDLTFLASQQSTGSDDQALEMAIAKHYNALREKKKKDKEKKFLQVADKQLTRDVSVPAEEFKTSVQAIESLYANFLLQYAAAEDTIRDIWTQIQTEQQTFLTLAQKRHSLNAQAAKKIETAHIAGLTRTKGACQDFQEIIDQIIPQDI